MIRHPDKYAKRKRRILLWVTIWSVVYLIALIYELRALASVHWP